MQGLAESGDVDTATSAEFVENGALQDLEEIAQDKVLNLSKIEEIFAQIKIEVTKTKEGASETNQRQATIDEISDRLDEIANQQLAEFLTEISKATQQALKPWKEEQRKLRVQQQLQEQQQQEETARLEREAQEKARAEAEEQARREEERLKKMKITTKPKEATSGTTSHRSLEDLVSQYSKGVREHGINSRAVKSWLENSKIRESVEFLIQNPHLLRIETTKELDGAVQEKISRDATSSEVVSYLSREIEPLTDFAKAAFEKLSHSRAPSPAPQDPQEGKKPKEKTVTFHVPE